MRKRVIHASCEDCRCLCENQTCEIEAEADCREDGFRYWRAPPTKTERIFSRASIIVSWILAPFFYYALYLLISGKLK